MSAKHFQTVLIGCLFVFSLQAAACSPYKGIQNSAYKSVSKELKSLKKTGVSSLDLETNYFEGWDKSTQISDALKKKYLSKAIQNWTIESIDETKDGLEVHVLLDSASLDFLEDEQLKKDYLPWLAQKAKTIQNDNPDISDQELEAQLQLLMEDALEKQLDEASNEQVQLIFLCDPADGSILSIYQDESE